MRRTAVFLVQGLLAMGLWGAPTISRFSPDHARSGDAAFTLTVTGAGFASGATVKWNGAALSTTFVSATQVTAQVDAGRVAYAGSASVTVESGGSASAALQFPITAGWTISNVSTHDADAGSADLTLVFDGSRLPLDGYLDFGGTRLQPSSVTASRMTVVVPASLLRTPGYVDSWLKSTACSCGVQDYFYVLMPVTSVSPNPVVAGRGAVTLTVKGTSFIPTLWGCLQPGYPPADKGCGSYPDRVLSATAVTEKEVTLSATADQMAHSGNYSLEIWARGADQNGVATYSRPFAIQLTGGPQISAVVPAELRANGVDKELIVNGSGFTTNSKVELEEQNNYPAKKLVLATTMASSTQLRAVFPGTELVRPRDWDATVVDGGARSTAQMVRTLALPMIEGIWPKQVRLGAEAFELRISGWSFGRDSVVLWDGAPLVTRYVFSTQVTATVPAALLTTAGTHAVAVRSLGDTSAAVNFIVDGETSGYPVVTSIDPSWVAQYNLDFYVTVYGSGFTSSSTGTVGGYRVKNAVITPTSMRGLVGMAFTYQNPGNYPVIVTNDSKASNAIDFTLAPPGPAPTITGISPSSVEAGSGDTLLTVTGTGFAPGGRITAGNQLFPTYVNAQTLTVVIPASKLYGPGVIKLGLQQSTDFVEGPPLIVTAKPTAQPTISSVSPAGITAGAAEFQLMIQGTNLGGGVVTFDGTVLNMSSSGGTSLTGRVPASLVTAAGTKTITVDVPGATRQSATFTVYPAPQLVSALPASVPAGLISQVVLLNGANFRTGATVTASSGQASYTELLTSAQISVQIRAYPFPADKSIRLTVVQDGVRSNTVTVPVYFNAKLLSLQPTQASAAQDMLYLSATGSGFIYEYALCWNGTPLTTSVMDTAHMGATVPKALYATAGTAQVTVCYQGESSSALPLQVTGGSVITGVAPSKWTAGNGVLALTVSGNSFPEGAIVRWNGTALTTAWSSGTLRAEVPAALVAEPQTARIQVMSQAGVELDSAVFAVVANPRITQLEPARMPVGGADVAMTIRGGGFFAPVKVRWNGTALTSTVISTSEVRATVPGTLRTVAGDSSVVVESGSEISSAAYVQVTQGLVLSSVAPQQITAGSGATTLTVEGSGFKAGAVVSWNGTALATTVVSSSSLTAVVPASLVAKAGTGLVVVTLEGNATTGLTVNVVEITQTQLTSAKPGFAVAGTAGFVLELRGSGFPVGSFVTWNGANLSTEWVEAGLVRAVVPAERIAEPGTVALLVVTPAWDVLGPLTFEVEPRVEMALEWSEDGQSVKLKLQQAATRAMTGELTLRGSASAAGLPAEYVDPVLQFLSGGRSATVSVAAGAVEAEIAGSGRVQMPAVAGDYSVVLTKLAADGASMVAEPAPAIAWSAGGLAPKVSALRLEGEELAAVVGSSTRELELARLTLEVEGKAEPVVVEFDLKEVTREWFWSETGQASGGQLELRIALSAAGAKASEVKSASVVVSGRGGSSEEAVWKR